MPNYAQTNVPRSALTQLVGKLDNPMQQTAGTPWANANEWVRRRVYAVREPRSIKKRFVTIDGRTVTANRKWITTVHISGLGRPHHQHWYHNSMQRMRGTHRNAAYAPAARNAAQRPPQRPLPRPPALVRQRPLQAAAPRPAARVPLPAGTLEVAAVTPICVICMDDEKPMCCVWSGCGHRAACLDCARKVTAPICPMCRAPGFPIAIRDA